MAVTNVERKITRIGNSLGITLPQSVLDHLQVKLFSRKGRRCIVQTSKNSRSWGVE
ncbi:AbrB/MazE/SpoVT family DNA-binding domain-containing protein [Aureibacillus halotolerans]|uniref:SpoVT-AbrB domain-containing protein n=1 Tax=Aureibacillus halotolerans TaxID=1508390 RepID=A0A4R6TXU0_9BACI|nr:hypothetical protein [Aureibacillus halotolerans]TDQ34623.1 hypothetical protein EV213_12441 [Aureibacillus halotolerans]